MSDFAAERGVSPVAGPRRWLKTKRSRQMLYVGVGMVALAMFGLSVNSILNFTPSSHPENTGSNMIGQTVATPAAAPYKPQPVEQAPAVVANAVQEAPKDYVRFPTSTGQELYAVAEPEKKEGKADTGEKDKAPPGTEVAFKPSEIAGGKAGKAIRLTYVMLPTMIPCILDTAMDSTLTGAIRCHTTEDILSPEHVLLMPAGTQIMGKYKNENGQGQNRLFAFTGSAITKEGIPVPLDSEVADGVGRAGIDGQVDHHYTERFGAALLLTVADAALSLGQTELSKAGQTNLNINGDGSGFSGLAQTILNKTINMPDTIYVQPGKQITIVTDHPIDFSDALRVTTRE
jgi:type IV secretion system protein VirB10